MTTEDLFYDCLWTEDEGAAARSAFELFERIKNGLSEREKSAMKKLALTEPHKGLITFVGLCQNGVICWAWFWQELQKIRGSVDDYQPF